MLWPLRSTYMRAYMYSQFTKRLNEKAKIVVRCWSSSMFTKQDEHTLDTYSAAGQHDSTILSQGS